MIGPSGSGVVWTTSVGSSGPVSGVSFDFVDPDFVSDFVPNITVKKKTIKKPTFYNY